MSFLHFVRRGSNTLVSFFQRGLSHSSSHIISFSCCPHIRTRTHDMCDGRKEPKWVLSSQILFQLYIFQSSLPKQSLQRMTEKVSFTQNHCLYNRIPIVRSWTWWSSYPFSGDLSNLGASPVRTRVCADTASSASFATPEILEIVSRNVAAPIWEADAPWSCEYCSLSAVVFERCLLGARLFLCTPGDIPKFRTVHVAKFHKRCTLNWSSVLFASRKTSAFGFTFLKSEACKF